MFGLKKLLSKRASEAGAASKRFQNKDLMEACIAGAVWVSFADGSLEDAEVKQLQGIMESNPSFAAFTTEIGATLDRFVRLFQQSGKLLGGQKALAEIMDCKGSEEEKMEVLLTMITIAAADGEVEPKEVEIIKKVGRGLGVNVDELLKDAM